MKFGWKEYFEPTPKLIRKFADSLMGMFTSIAAFQYFNDKPKTAFVLMLISTILKYVSNFFTDTDIKRS